MSGSCLWEKKKIDWVDYSLSDDNHDTTIQVSNGKVPLDEGLSVQSGFVSPEEAASILDELDGGDCSWIQQGFLQRRHVQTFDLTKNETIPGALQRLVDRFERQQSTPNVHQVIVQDFPHVLIPYHANVGTSVATIFESSSMSEEYFVAQISLVGNTMQHLNKPRRRQVDCWQLETKDHWTDIHMMEGDLCIKRGPILDDWRYRMARSSDIENESQRVVLVKMVHLGDPLQHSIPTTTTQSSGQRRIADAPIPATMPPLPDLLTIIVTTSPIKSNPSTELLEQIFDTFHFAGAEFLQCPKVIVCDGCRIKGGKHLAHENGSKVSQKYSNTKQALRNGIATSEQAQKYEEFKERLIQLCQEKNNNTSSPFVNTTVEVLQERHGYGFALRHALRHCINTPYVCVIQHDRTFMRTTPIRQTLEAMYANPDKIKYVGMNMRSNLIYRDIFMSKYGKEANQELGQLVLRPPQLLLDEPIPPTKVECNAALSRNLEALGQRYVGTTQNQGHLEWLAQQSSSDNISQCSLTPTLFWYDNVHICETAHYRDFIFDPVAKMVARGGFVEDKLSPVILRVVEKWGLAKGHARFGCYLLDDHSGCFFTGHMDGGSFLVQSERAKLTGNKTEEKAH